MASYTIEISGLDRVISAFQKAPQLVTKELADAVLKSQLIVQRNAKLEVPVDTGNLQKGITIASDVSSKGLTGLILDAVVYAPYIEYGEPIGTGPHGGPKPFMRMGAEDSMAQIQTTFNDAVKNIADKML